MQIFRLATFSVLHRSVARLSLRLSFLPRNTSICKRINFRLGRISREFAPRTSMAPDALQELVGRSDGSVTYLAVSGPVHEEIGVLAVSGQLASHL